jgi:hypothetical protein
MAVLLEIGEREDCLRDFLVGDPQLQALRGLELEAAVDHPVEHLAWNVQRADQLRGELALVLGLLAFELGAVAPVELGPR